MNSIQRLGELGQSVWLDFLEHRLITAGDLDRMIDEGIQGVTSNPTIFQKAIDSSDAYDEFIHGAPSTVSDRDVFESIQVLDVQLACDRLRRVHERTGGGDGFASIEVSPGIARDTDASTEEARRLWRRVARPNAMVKIPGTREGLAAIEECLTEGVNINVTLLFSVARYERIVEAHLRALERRIEKGEPVRDLSSVASFFVSRVDASVDKLLDAVIRLGGSAADYARSVRGRAALTNARAAYEVYRRVLASARWKRLASRGARPQRVLWASTSPKDPAYRDLYYAESLIGRGTIDTMTPATFRAFLEHGKPEPALDVPEQRQVNDAGVSALGISLEKITDALEAEGIAAFESSFARAVAAVGAKRRGGRRSHDAA